MNEGAPYVIVDGQLKKATQPVLTVHSRGLLYGDGCFETFRSYKGGFLKPEMHLRRLDRGLKFLGIRYPEGLKMELFSPQLENLLSQNELLNEDVGVRLQVWRKGSRGYRVSVPGEGRYAVTTFPLPNKLYSCKLATVDVKRIPSTALPAKYKLSNAINHVTASKQALKKGADDALMETTKGWVSETTIANIFWKINKTVFTPSLSCDILPGVTRDILINLLKNSLQVQVEEGTYKVDDILKADCVWATNSIKEIIPVRQLNGMSYETESSFLKSLKETFSAFRNEQITVFKR